MYSSNGSPRRTSPRQRTLALVCAQALALAGCSDGPSPAAAPKGAPERTAAAADAPKLRKVRIQLNWVPEPEFGGIYAARDLGLFEKEGLEVEIIKGSAGVPSPQLTADGKVEFGVVGGDQVLTMRAQGAPLVALYACFKTFPRGFVVHEANPVKGLPSLWQTGSTIAVEPGLPFVKWLNHTYPTGKPRLVASQGGLAGFIRDPGLSQAVFVFSEPVELKQRKVAVRTLRVADSGYNPYSVVVATSEDFLKKDRDTATRFVRALRLGWERYLQDPAPTNRVMAKLNAAMGLEAMTIATELAAPYVRGETGELGEMTLERWRTLGAQMKTVGALDTLPEPRASFLNLR